MLTPELKARMHRKLKMAEAHNWRKPDTDLALIFNVSLQQIRRDREFIESTDLRRLVAEGRI